MGLDSFEGHDVIASGVEMPGASGGLNKALRVSDLQLHHGDRVTLVLDCEVVKLRFDEVKDSDSLERIHVLRVHNAAPIDGDVVVEVLEQQRRRVEEAKGVQSLPYADVDEPDAQD
jgi:hypothetical protein